MQSLLLTCLLSCRDLILSSAAKNAKIAVCGMYTKDMRTNIPTIVTLSHLLCEKSTLHARDREREREKGREKMKEKITLHCARDSDCHFNQ